MVAARFAVTGLGMVTSVGRDVVRACAAIRAGISRPRELEAQPMVVDADSGEESLVIAHPIDGMTDGFAVVGAWMTMALEALDDLVGYAALPGAEDGAFWSRTGLLVVVAADLTERFGPGGDDMDALEEAYLRPLVALWKRPLDLDVVALVPAGNAAGHVAIERACNLLGQGVCDRLIVLAADSYLDTSTIAWLRDRQKLKAIDNPVGVSPGEAAACILIESSSSAQRRGARVEAFVAGVGVDQQDRAKLDASALTRALRACLRGTDAPAGAVEIDLVSDIDGQHWRAQELGTMMANCPDLRLHWGSWGCPATSLGHTGAASAIVGSCVAVRSLVRQCTTAQQVVVLGSAENGQVGAVRFSSATT